MGDPATVHGFKRGRRLHAGIAWVTVAGLSVWLAHAFVGVITGSHPHAGAGDGSLGATETPIPVVHLPDIAPLLADAEGGFRAKLVDFAVLSEGDHDHDAIRDDEWSGYPRTVGSLVRMVADVGSNGASRVRKLYRNIPLNPRDTYIPTQRRAELQKVFDTLRPKLSSCYQAWVNVYSRDFEQAISEGRADVVELPVTVREVERRDGTRRQVMTFPITTAGPSTDMYSVRNGVTYATSRRRHPASRSALEQQAFVELELSVHIVRWFESVGCLEAHEARSLEQQAFLECHR